MRGGFAFSRITDLTGTRRNVSDPIRSSPTGSQASDAEHANEDPDQLSPLLDAQPAKRGIKDRLKRPRKSDTSSDPDGSLSGGSQGQARKDAMLSTRNVPEMGVLQSRTAHDLNAVRHGDEERASPADLGVKDTGGPEAEPGRLPGVSGRIAPPTPPPTETWTSPRPTRIDSTPVIQPARSSSPRPLAPTLSSALSPPPTPAPATPSPASTVCQGASAMLAEDIRQLLIPILREEMSPRARAELERIMGWRSPLQEAENPALGPSYDPGRRPAGGRATELYEDGSGSVPLQRDR